jgi:diaminopimelate decarboxylase
MSKPIMSLNRDLLKELTSIYGDSFYILDSLKFEKNYDEFLYEFRRYYPKTYIGYSYKTNYIPKLCSIIKEKNGYAEVVSNMEFDLAIKIGMNPEKIIVNGPNKRKDDLKRMLLLGSIINLDSFNEIEIIKEIASNNKNRKLRIGFRCNFEINGVTNSRFGFDVKSKIFFNVFQELQNIENVHIMGLHCHFPNRNLESYESRVENIITQSDRLFPNNPEYLSIGGGYSGKMVKSLEKQFKYKIPSFQEYANVVASKFNSHYKNFEYNSKPKLFLEPGTAIVSDTMKFVAKVIDIRNISGNIIATTTGSKFNLGSFSSVVNLPLTIYSRMKNKTDNYYNSIDIAGYTCIESDYLYKGYVGHINVGDYVVFGNVGSYSFLFKPPFILPNVAIIDLDVTNNYHKVVKRKELFSDIFGTFINETRELDG